MTVIYKIMHGIQICNLENLLCSRICPRTQVIRVHNIRFNNLFTGNKHTNNVLNVDTRSTLF